MSDFIAGTLLCLSLYLSYSISSEGPNISNGKSSDSKPRKFVEPPENTFLPGSLRTLSRTETLQKCYVDPKRYKSHIVRNTLCTYSENYNLMYYMLPKSGSSTGRHVMKYSFDAIEYSPIQCQNLDVSRNGARPLVTASMRNPLSRFFASYDEMFVRRLGRPSRIPLRYNQFMKPYSGWEYPQYSALFNTVSGVKRLTDTFEEFVHLYDGQICFDEHLGLQTALLAKSNGAMKRIDLVFNTHDMEKSLHEIADIVKAPKPNVIRGRAYPRRINTTALKRETIQKICELAAIDFCCLNYELPQACLDEDIPIGMRVRCEWIEKPFVQDGRMIQAVLV